MEHLTYIQWSLILLINKRERKTATFRTIVRICKRWDCLTHSRPSVHVCCFSMASLLFSHKAHKNHGVALILSSTVSMKNDNNPFPSSTVNTQKCIMKAKHLSSVFPCPSPANWGLWRTVVSYVSVCHSALFKLNANPSRIRAWCFPLCVLPHPFTMLGTMNISGELSEALLIYFGVTLKSWWRNITQFN